MAITAIAPDAGPQPIPDPVTFEEAAVLFKETQLPEFAGNANRVANKLYQWARKDGLAMRPGPGRRAVVSYTGLLDAHERRYPAPRR
jgi:hypothetical protein